MRRYAISQAARLNRAVKSARKVKEHGLNAPLIPIRLLTQTWLHLSIAKTLIMPKGSKKKKSNGTAKTMA